MMSCIEATTSLSRYMTYTKVLRAPQVVVPNVNNFFKDGTSQSDVVAIAPQAHGASSRVKRKRDNARSTRTNMQMPQRKKAFQLVKKTSVEFRPVFHEEGQEDTTVTQYYVGDPVRALWDNGHLYSGTIKEELEDGIWRVLFEDGDSKDVASAHMHPLGVEPVQPRDVVFGDWVSTKPIKITQKGEIVSTLHHSIQWAIVHDSCTTIGRACSKCERLGHHQPTLCGSLDPAEDPNVSATLKQAFEATKW